ncbi:sulfotransferase domain-containing protein [Azospirillum halopraeferens]|uniref:sulfotransferase domain-containing protein n=1 Tax=Azospirillum halopraeferens TaxID=34010 RepID=UPI0003F7735F|nr:sulfotransferase domain-containing protein [Azospirillum halopraeferens]
MTQVDPVTDERPIGDLMALAERHRDGASAGEPPTAERAALRARMATVRTAVEAVHIAQAHRAAGGLEDVAVGDDPATAVREILAALGERFAMHADRLGSFGESEVSDPRRVVRCASRPLSEPVLTRTRTILHCLDHVRPRRVMEVADGYGDLARLWLGNGIHRAGQCVIVDVPERLFFAEVFARLHAPAGDIVYVDDGTDAESLTRRRGAPRIVLCPAHRLDRILPLPVDLCHIGRGVDTDDGDMVAALETLMGEQGPRWLHVHETIARPLDDPSGGVVAITAGLGPNRRIVDRVRTGPAGAEVLVTRDRAPAVRRRAEADRLWREHGDALPFGEGFPHLLDAVRRFPDGPRVRILIERCLAADRLPRDLLHLLILAPDCGGAALLPPETLLRTGIALSARARARPEAVFPASLRNALDSLRPAAGLGVARDPGGAVTARAGGTTLPMRTGQLGAVEVWGAAGGAARLVGWAVDPSARIAAVRVLVFCDGRPVDSIVPTVDRTDFGGPAIRCGFKREFGVPVDWRPDDTIVVVAEFADGSLVHLPLPERRPRDGSANAVEGLRAALAAAERERDELRATYESSPAIPALRRVLDGQAPAAGGRHLLVACMMKSGSTFLSKLLARCLGFAHISLDRGGDRREQELDPVTLARWQGADYVAQNHLRHSVPTERLLTDFGVTPIVLVRNIFDVVVSMRDHMRGESPRFPMAYADEVIAARDDAAVEDFLVRLAVPWFFNFYVGWWRSGTRLIVTYEELVADTPGTVQRILDVVGLTREDADLRAAIAAMSGEDTRRNQARTGRGAGLAPDLRALILAMAQHYPDVDFRPIGITPPPAGRARRRRGGAAAAAAAVAVTPCADNRADCT